MTGYIPKLINNKIMIVDDQLNTRKLLGIQVKRAKFFPFVQNNPIGDISDFFEIITKEQPYGIIIDNNLTGTNYATFDGIDIVEKLFFIKMPIILVSRGVNDISKTQSYRQYIPTIIEPEKINPDIIIKSFELSQNELNGIYTPERRPWRSLICVEEISEDKNYVYVVIPSWNLDEKVKIPVSMLPQDYLRNLRPDLHFFAQVNVDNEHYQDLYFRDFEPLKELKPKYAKLIHS